MSLGRRARVASADQVPAGRGCVVEVSGRSLALFNIDGAYYAIDNRCPHRGGPLGEGELHGRIVTCPWHGWRWDVSTGASANNPAMWVACFPVTTERGDVFVEIG